MPGRPRSPSSEPCAWRAPLFSGWNARVLHHRPHRCQAAAAGALASGGKPWPGCWRGEGGTRLKVKFKEGPNISANETEYFNAVF